MLKPNTLFLAPMEGVVDSVLRKLIGDVGGVDICTTEFVRITHQLLPKKVYDKYCPELEQHSLTDAGQPVLLQLLGGDPSCLAENAAFAIEIGAYGIDLNFGCPAKTVNRHDGGATLLKNPERIFQVVQAVRKAVPAHKSVSAKIRLGFDHKEQAIEIAQAAESGGASWLTVHARTKTDGYRPPAHWDYIAKIKQTVKLPVVANGEIWSFEDYLRCREVSGCEHFMLGRGLVANPGLAFEIKNQLEKKNWSHWISFLQTFMIESKNYRHENYAVQRTKQMLKIMMQSYPEARETFEKIKTLSDYSDIFKTLGDIALTKPQSALSFASQPH